MLNCLHCLRSYDFPNTALNSDSGGPLTSASYLVSLYFDVNEALIVSSFTIEEEILYLIGFLR
jgi:hypothetical protein